MRIPDQQGQNHGQGGDDHHPTKHGGRLAASKTQSKSGGTHQQDENRDGQLPAIVIRNHIGGWCHAGSGNGIKNRDGGGQKNLKSRNHQGHASDKQPKLAGGTGFFTALFFAGDFFPAQGQKEYHQSKKQNQKVTLIGWSLGGYLARETARDNPELVEQVITIASPLFGGAKYTSIADYYAEKQGIQLDELEQQIEARYDIPLQVPSLSIYSKLDNIVSWQTCIDTRTPLITHKEVQATHLGMILNPDVYKTISEYLYDHFHRLDPKD